jgi:calcium permeable stress-gated cation channel
VTQIPKPLTTDEGLVRIVDSITDKTVIPRGAIARNVKDLPDLIDEHEAAVRKLEGILAKYLKNPDKLPLNRPTCKISKKDPEYTKGQKVDAIEYLTKRIQHLEKMIRDVRESVDQRNAMSYGFASYDSIEEAHTVAYAALRKKNAHKAIVRLAPRPSDILWDNLPLSPKTRRARAITNNLWVVLLTLVWIAPNALIAVFLSNLNNLGLIWPAFRRELTQNPKTWAVVQGVLAPAITSLVYFILPTIFRRLSMKAGDLTKTSRERHVTHKLYAFFIFNNLIVFSIFGAVWQYITAVINETNKDPNKNVWQVMRESQFYVKIMYALCNVSPFWVTWLLQRNLGAAVDLSQVVNLAWGSFQRRFLSPTPRQLIELSAPPPFDYASYYNYFLFYATVALCFATLQPLVLPLTAFYFCLDAWLKKYLLMYVFVTKTESGGQFWRMLFNRFLVAVFLSNVVVALLVYARTELIGPGWTTMLASMVPLPILLLLLKFYCKRQFDDQIHFFTKGEISEESLSKSENMSLRSNQLGIRFGHPALFKPLMTPMVHAKSQHLLAQVYNGRIDDEDYDDLASQAGYSDVYSMRNMSRAHGRKGSKALKSSPFEFVNESEIDFENFKNRPEFRSEFGGDGEVYGKPEDQISRKGTPVPSDLAGTTYPHGYSPAAMRGYSPSPDRFGASVNSSAQDVSGQGQYGLIRGAAPMGAGPQRPSVSRTSSGEESYRGRQR